VTRIGADDLGRWLSGPRTTSRGTVRPRQSPERLSILRPISVPS